MRLLLLAAWLMITISYAAMAQDTTVKGRVSLKGQGFAGATLLLWKQPSGVPSQQGTHKTRTDAAGNFQLSAAEGNYFAWVVVPGFVVVADGSPTFQLRPVSLNAGHVSDLNFEIEKGAVITGRITDSNDRPITGAEITLTVEKVVQAPFMEAQSNWSTTITDDRGIYRLFGVPGGSYHVSARETSRNNNLLLLAAFYPSGNDKSKARVVTVRNGEEASDVDIKMGAAGPTYRVNGKVVDRQSGEPIVNSSISVNYFQGETRTGGRGLLPTTNSRGEFSIDGLPAGRYSISSPSGPARSDYNGESVRFNVVDQDVEGVEVKVSRNADVWGRVKLEGEGSPDAFAKLRQLRLFVTSSPKSVGTSGGPVGRGNSVITTINTDGSFLFSGIFPGALNFFLQNQADNTQFTILRVEHPEKKGQLEVSSGEYLTGVTVVVAEATARIRGVIKLPPGVSLQDIKGRASTYQNGRVTGGIFVVWCGCG